MPQATDGGDSGEGARASQASWLAIRDPPEKPVAYTRPGSMQYRCSRMCTKVVRNATSLAAPVGTAFPPMSGTPGTFQSYPVPSGINPCG